MSINPGAHSGAAQSKLFQTAGSSFNALDTELDLSRIAAKLLAQTDRRGVGQVGTTDLHNGIKFFSFTFERRVQPLECRQSFR